MRVSHQVGFENVQAAKRQARAQAASFGRGMAPEPGIVRNLHKRKAGGARRGDYYGDPSNLPSPALCLTIPGPLMRDEVSLRACWQLHHKSIRCSMGILNGPRRSGKPAHAAVTYLAWIEPADGLKREIECFHCFR